MKGPRRTAVQRLTGLALALVVGVGAGFGTSMGIAAASSSHSMTFHAKTESWGSIGGVRIPAIHDGDPHIVLSPDFASDRTAFLATPQGVWATTNGGRSWQCVGFCGQVVESVEVSPNFQAGRSGWVYALLSEPTRPSGQAACRTIILGCAQLWLADGSSIAGTSVTWYPTRVALAGIDAFAVNDAGTLFMDVTSPEWLEWKAECSLEASSGASCKPTLVLHGPGLYSSAGNGVIGKQGWLDSAWSYVFLPPDGAGCGLVFGVHGTVGWLADVQGDVWETVDNGSSWSASASGDQGAAPLGALAMPGSNGGQHGYPGYLLDALGGGIGDCRSGMSPGGLGLFERQLSLADQGVLAVAGDPELTWPGHQRDAAFVATDRGIYVGAVDVGFPQ